MTEAKQKLTFDVVARRIDAHSSIATCKSATIELDTDPAGNPDAFNPAELLLAALAACMAFDEALAAASPRCSWSALHPSVRNKRRSGTA